MNVDIPPIDAGTFWSGLVAIIATPVLWLRRKLSHLETNYVSKKEFKDTLEALDQQHHLRTQSIRSDIAKIEASNNIILQHLLSIKK
jgi:hypothetical protein